jgi:hypothetical protein
LHERKHGLTINGPTQTIKCAGARKEIEMAHAVKIQSKQQYIRAVRVLDKVGGTWRGVGPSSNPVLLLTDTQYEALREAGVVGNNREVNIGGKKAPKKTKP